MDWQAVTIIILVAALVITALFFLRFAAKSNQTIEDQAAAIRTLRESEGRRDAELIQSTLNPHLFKNVLNSIQSHAYQTYYAMDRLAGVLDYILYDSRRPFVSVKEEILFAENLIEINKIKLSPLFELQVRNRIDAEDQFYGQAVMAPLVTIDLIENAFKHADIQSADAFITIVLELQNGVFTMSVTNKISSREPLAKPKSGIGTRTLEERLRTVYGTCCELLRSRRDGEYAARLTINFHEYTNTLRAAGR